VAAWKRNFASDEKAEAFKNISHHALIERTKHWDRLNQLLEEALRLKLVTKRVFPPAKNSNNKPVIAVALTKRGCALHFPFFDHEKSFAEKLRQHREEQLAALRKKAIEKIAERTRSLMLFGDEEEKQVNRNHNDNDDEKEEGDEKSSGMYVFINDELDW